LIRRQAARITLREKLTAAQAAVARGDLITAATLYDDAWVLIQSIGAGVDDEREMARAGLASVRLELAQAAQRRGDLREADKQIQDLLALTPQIRSHWISATGTTNCSVSRRHDGQPGCARAKACHRGIEAAILTRVAVAILCSTMTGFCSSTAWLAIVPAASRSSLLFRSRKSNATDLWGQREAKSWICLSASRKFAAPLGGLRQFQPHGSQAGARHFPLVVHSGADGLNEHPGIVIKSGGSDEIAPRDGGLRGRQFFAQK